MSHALHVIPDNIGTAAENMAYDFLLLQRYRPDDALRIRHYEWRRPAFTFGMSQRFSYVDSEIDHPNPEICRRPTGGGLVNHLEDWTYALVIPAGHPLAELQPQGTYKAVHQAIATAISRQGTEVELNETPPSDPTPGVCFNKAELYDVVLKNLPTKVAGAAQKRTKLGYLLQGSIWKPPLASLDWNRFYTDFILEICTVADAEISYEAWPSWVKSEVETLVNQFDSDNWNTRR